MLRFPVLACAVAFLGGIASAWLGTAAAISIACGIVAVGFAPRLPWTRLRMIGCIAFAAGSLDGSLAGHRIIPVPDRHVHRFISTVVDMRPASDGGTTLTVRLADGDLATFDARDATPSIGEKLFVRAKRDVFDEPRNPGEPSERELQAERGIEWRLVTTRILATAPPDPTDASLWIPRLRALASRRLHATIAEPGATILAGALWGERGTLPRDLRAEFQDTGTVHILVTAGLHLGVVAALALALLRGCACGRISASIATIAIVWLYAAFSGDHLPSVRAATMLSFGLVAYALGREALTWNALGAAAIVIAARDPASEHSVSFALSFSCVAAILAFASPIARFFEGLGSPKFVAGLAAASLATQLGTWPLTAATFLTIAPYAPLANFAVVPIVGVVMLAGFAALAATPIPFLAATTNNIVTSLLDWILACVRVVSAFPGAHVIATPPPTYAIVLYDVALAGAALSLVHRKYVVPAFLMLTCASALCLWPPHHDPHDLEITAIDVGQADAILIRTPNRHAYLVDAGGRLERGGASSGASSAENIGERIVVPFLIRSGIHHLDAILLSHPHGDHAGGIAPVLRMLGADGFADSGQTYPGHAYHDALDVARNEHIPMIEPRGGDVWRTSDGVTFRFYGPTYPYITGSRSDINSNSLVFRVEYGHFAMLFMGDAGTETETRLLTNGADLHADVLKVGHHGSAYGTTAAFVRAVAPRFAIVSVGRHNLFGHPAPQTIETLRDAGTAVYRTDEDGAVTLRTDGATVAVEPALAH